MRNRKAIPMIAYLLLLFAVFSWANELFSDNADQIPYSQVVSLIRNEQVKALEVSNEVITMELYTPIDGETIIRASVRFFGTKKYWPYIVKHNMDVLPDPDNIPAGIRIKIPKLVEKNK